jgi:putative SOS response-associated peptidase YedK
MEYYPFLILKKTLKLSNILKRYKTMCFNTKMTLDALSLEEVFDVPANSQTFQQSTESNLSGFDHPQMPIVLNDSIEMCRWGLIPSWVKDRESALKIQNQTLNARSESVFEKPSFKEAILSRRCIIPVESFFETQHQGKVKVPFEIFPSKGKVLSLAGIWEIWTSPESQTPTAGFSILTCPANDVMAKIHNTKKRMPVILELAQISQWLNPKLNAQAISEFLNPSPNEALTAKTMVNTFIL